jgi:hypothetical protein
MVPALLLKLLTTDAASAAGQGGNQMTEWISAFSIITLLAVAGFAAAAFSGHEGGSDKNKKGMIWSNSLRRHSRV